MMTGQLLALSGIGLVLLLALGGLHLPLAVAAPLFLLGLGHGLVMPSTLAGTVSTIPALAGAAAGLAGLLQQLSGAAGGYVVGLVTHDNATNLALMLMTCMLAATLSQLYLTRHEPLPASPTPVP